MRLYYVHEAESRRRHVRTALGVDAEVWNDFLRAIRHWRQELWCRHGIPCEWQLRPSELLNGSVGLHHPSWTQSRMPTSGEGEKIFAQGLRCIEEAARAMGGIEVINVCLYKPDCGDYRRVGLNRLLNRINASVATENRHAFLIFRPGEEGLVSRTYWRLRTFNPVPSRYEQWEDGRRIRNKPLENVIGGPAFRSSGSDWLLQMARLVAHALLMQEEEPSLWLPKVSTGQAFGILDCALNRRASRQDPHGVVRR